MSRRGWEDGGVRYRCDGDGCGARVRTAFMMEDGKLLCCACYRKAPVGPEDARWRREMRIAEALHREAAEVQRLVRERRRGGGAPG